MKKCNKCGIEKELSEFGKDKARKDGLKSICKVCNYKQTKSRRLSNKESYRNIQKRYARTIKGRYNNLKSSAKRRGLEMKITFKKYTQIIEENKCFYCDTISVGLTGHSLNRIDSSKGYTHENVKICCGICNQIMSNYSIEELSCRVFKIIARMKKLQEESK